MQLQNKVLLYLIKAQSERWKENNWFQGFRRIYFIANIEVNAASFDKIAKLLDFLYLTSKVAGDETLSSRRSPPCSESSVSTYIS